MFLDGRLLPRLLLRIFLPKEKSLKRRGKKRASDLEKGETQNATTRAKMCHEAILSHLSRAEISDMKRDFECHLGPTICGTKCYCAELGK